MKNKPNLLLVCGACLALTSTRRAWAEPFDESKGLMFYAIAHPIKKLIVPPSRELAVDEAIIALAKASDINFIADATQIPAGVQVAPFPATPAARDRKWQPQFYSVTGDFEEAAQLAELRYAERTFLLWKRPDVVETARALLAAGKLRLPEAPPEQFALYRAVDDFYQNSTGWSNHPVTGVFRVDALPPATGEQLLSLTRYKILRPDLKRELLLSDSYWKAARVRLVPSDQQQDRGRTSLLVYVGGQDENGNAAPFFRAFPQGLELPQRLKLLGEGSADYVYPVAEAPLNAPPVVALDGAPVVPGLTATELEAQGPLKAPVSLEVKRQPLSAVLYQASKQGGVTLSLAANVPEVLVTARVQKMPLHELMGALSRLCGASWQKDAAGYGLQAQPLQPWQKLLLRSGQGDFEGFGIESQFTLEQLQPLRDLEQSVVDEVSQQPQTPQGVPFSSLSPDVQAQLKGTTQAVAANTLVRAYNNAFLFSSPQAMLHFTGNPIGWQVWLLMADDREFLAGVQLHQPPPKKKENAPFAEPTDDTAHDAP